MTGAGQNGLSGGTETLFFRRHADTPSREPRRGCSGETGPHVSSEIPGVPWKVRVCLAVASWHHVRGGLQGGRERNPPPQLWQEESSVTVNLQEVLSPRPLDDHPYWSCRFSRGAPGHRFGPRSTSCDMGLGAPEPAPGSIQRPPLSPPLCPCCGHGAQRDLGGA